MTTTHPTVSVIVPAYNAAAYVGEALASAQAQTLADIEILVCDDASTDATGEVVAAVARADPRVRYLRLEVNGGPSAARNRGFDEARGRWLALLDADDVFVPERLERMLALAEARGAVLCSDNLMLVPEAAPDQARPMIPVQIVSEPRSLELAEFLHRNVADPAHPGLNYGFLKPIMRRDFIVSHGIRYDEAVRFAEDFAFYVDCFRAGATWWMMPETGYRYLVRGNSLTQVQTVHDLGVLRRRLAGLFAESVAVKDVGLSRIIQRHQRVIDRCYHYRAFTDALKEKRFGAAGAEFMESPRSARLIVEELAHQMPTISAKLLKGGYFQRTSKTGISER